MLELLALPGWNTPTTTLDAWVAQLQSLGVSVVVERESSEVSWLEITVLRTRGYAVNEGLRLEAINFEFHDPDPANAVELVQAAALALGWELHPDEPDDDDEPGGE
jgi:hypothetical protein